VVAAFQMAADLGAVVGPLVAGLLADEYSYSAAFLATAAVVAVGLLAAAFSAETRHRTAAAQPVESPPAG
jgi:dipeptide/tripeptide permease